MVRLAYKGGRTWNSDKKEKKKGWLIKGISHQNNPPDISLQHKPIDEGSLMGIRVMKIKKEGGFKKRKLRINLFFRKLR
ncbi:hypothetical protein KEJ19_00995 [Candidatus Bathyarchaeota archaeon]|nr:hypothetical protein [Candidatus Bathyarchaeota archaeon]